MSNGNGKDAKKKLAEKPEEVKDPKEKEEKESPPEIPESLKGKDPKAKKKPELPPIPLTKSQLKLYRSKMIEHEAMKSQVAGVINQLGNEVRRGLVEGFAEENGIDLMAKKYEFDRETLQFVDFNVLRERLRMQQGMPQSLIPSSRRR